MSEPLDLDAIRDRKRYCELLRSQGMTANARPVANQIVMEDVPALLAEVDRLTAAMLPNDDRFVAIHKPQWAEVNAELERLRAELAEITDQRDQLHDRGRQIERAIAAAETQRNNALAAVDNITNTLAKVRASLTEQAATYESAVEFLGGEIDRLTAELASRPRALPDGVVVTEYTVPLPPGASIPFRGDVIYVRADGLGRWRIANGADTLSVPWLTAAGEWSYDRSADARWTDLDAALTAAQAAAHEITVGGRTAGQVLAEEQDRGRS